MFSGKSEELIRRLRRAQIAKRKVQIFKPKIDDRFGGDHIISHSEMRIASVNLSSSRELLAQVLPDTEVVGVDEGQFFDGELPAVCSALADQGKRVIVAGLDQDYLGKPFEPMPQLLAIAEYITKTLAICMVGGAPANHTQPLPALPQRRRAHHAPAPAGARQRARAGRGAGHLRAPLPLLFRPPPRAVTCGSWRGIP